MKIKTFLLITFSFTSVALFATPEKDNLNSSTEVNEFTYCFREDQQIDTQDWIRFPVNIAVDQDKVEAVELLFPSLPEFINVPLTEKPFIVAKDSEGMTYKFSRMKLPGNEYNLRQSFEFLIDALSSDNKINGYGYPEPNPNDSGYFLSYVNKDGKETTLTLVKSKNFIYFLETSVINKLYLDVESIEIDDNAFEIMIHDSMKHGAFARSLVIGGTRTASSNSSRINMFRELSIVHSSLISQKN